MSGIKWSRKSTRRVSAELTRKGHPVSPGTAGRLLKDMGFSLQVNVKRLWGKRHPHREQPFQQIAKRVQEYRREGLPVLSMDAKKKEIIGNFRNAGRSWRQEELAVNDHDFLRDAIGKAVPYGM